MPDSRHILLATLGGQPQVVTFTLDLLLRDFPIHEVIVLHPKASQPRLQRSLARLSAEFVGDYYQAAHRVVHFRSHVLQLEGQPIDDITDDTNADAALDTIHTLIGSLKRQGHHIHLSLTGGRRLMSLLAIPVALFNFDRHDHIWHIYTPDPIQEQAKEGKLMHVPMSAGVRLIQGQFIPLGAYVYDPSQPFRSAQAQRRSQMDAQEHSRCADVEAQLKERELEVLKAFARGLTPQQVAQTLSLSIKTVDHYKTRIFDLCRQAWPMESNAYLSYHFLQKTFAPYFARTDYTSRE